ncbi:MAG: DUF3592 domain-containing protein [Lentisphaerae bacterium]|nr:DUF3592 domain-containing protein [Lentisphaerota bacterium]
MKTKGITMRTPRTGTGGIFGRIFATVFGLIFGSIGLMMMVLAVRDSLQRLETRHWVATPCEIVESGITEEGEQYRFDAVFTYNYNGQSHIARNFTHKGGLRKERIGDAQRLLNQYAKGAGATCHVNPAAPDEALILRDLSLGGLVGPVLFMLPFVLFGYGLIFLVWRFRRPEAQSGTTSSNTKPSRAAMAFPIIFGVVFIAVGLFVTCAFFVKPFLRQQVARAWTPVEAVVEQSRVRTHSGDDSTTYSVDITYRYRIGGREYRGDRYHFRSGSSSGYEAKQRVVAAHPAGSTLRIYVNPADPFDSVIVRDMGASLYLGLLPLIFTIVGILILGFGIHVCRRVAHPPTGAATWTLRPAFRAGKPLGVLLFGLFWNGIISVFVVQCLREWQSGGRPIGTTLFMVPFVLVGAGCIVWFFIELLRLFNPRIILIPPPGPIVPSLPTMLTYRSRRRIDRVTRLTISLVGRGVERDGGDDASVRELHRIVVHEQEQPLLMQEGLFRLTLPPELMGREPDPYNPISWHLEVRGKIPRGLDIVEAYRLRPNR